MANRFDKKGGFADMAAIQRKRSKTTPEKIDEEPWGKPQGSSFYNPTSVSHLSKLSNNYVSAKIYFTTYFTK